MHFILSGCCLKIVQVLIFVFSVFVVAFLLFLSLDSSFVLCVLRHEDFKELACITDFELSNLDYACI